MLIFGGSGFVGQHLVALLRAQQPQCRIVVADIVAQNDFPENVKFVECDVRNPIDPKLFEQGIDTIVNLAAVHKTPGHPSHEYFETNIRGAENICALAEKLNVDQIVFTSSIAIYGPGENRKTEESVPMPVIPYGISKAIAEGIHREWASAESTRKLSMIRPAVIFGMGEKGNFTRIAAALRKGIFVYPGRKNTVKSCCYVKDICRFIVHLAETKPQRSLHNFCYPEMVTTEKVCNAFRDALGFKMPKAVMPTSAVNTGAAVLKMINTPFIRSLGLDPQRIAKLVTSTNISSDRLVSSGFEFKYDLVSAIKDWAADCGTNKLF